MEEGTNRPIFVVGSPRSGTSIFTWCLGQHPNIFPVPESNWMGDFAVHVAVAYQVGAGRGDHSILSAMDIGDDELFAAFGQKINGLILRHRRDLERKRQSKRPAGITGRWVRGRRKPKSITERTLERNPFGYLVKPPVATAFPSRSAAVRLSNHPGSETQSPSRKTT